MTINAGDRGAILDLIARYCWHVDEGDADGWAALFTKDAVVSGIPEPMVGHDQLRKMPPTFHGMGGGKLRHIVANIAVEEGKTADDATAKGYSYVYDLRAGAGTLMAFSGAHFTLARQRGQWKIKGIRVDQMFVTGAHQSR